MNNLTQDQRELDHFRGLSEDWWDEGGTFRVLHRINPVRLAFIKERVESFFQISMATSKPFKGLRILDVGCGGGILSEPLARQGADVMGIDPVHENIATAGEHASEMGLEINYQACAIEDLPSDTPAFDVILLSEIIEHVDNQEAFLAECAKHLRPKGAMVVTTLNKTLKSYVLGIVAAESILNWAPKGTHTWDKFIAPETLSKMLLALGFKKIDVQGLTFSPLTGKWTLSSDTDINYFLWAQRR